MMLMLGWTFSQSPKPFYYDSRLYWWQGTSFDVTGRFSLLNFNSPLRGYFLPLVNRELRAIADALSWNHSSLAKLFNVLIFSLIATVLVPRLAELTWPDRPWGLARRLALAAILILLWGGYLAFPLSDFPAVAAVLLALVAAARSDSLLWMLTAGIACGIAIDMRPAYLLLAPILAVMVLMDWWRDSSRGRRANVRRALCVGLALLGFAAVSVPQSLATHRHFGTWSFIPGSAAGLASLQYTDGMRLQLYNTYVGTGEPGPQMNYIDATGTRLLEQDGGTIQSTSQYVKLIASHPLAMLGLFARHLINGLDHRYNTPYVEHLPGSDAWMRIAGFAFVFLALMRVAWPATRRRLGVAHWRYQVALLASGITAIVSAVETRFMLPAALVSYMLVLTPGWSGSIRAAPFRLRRSLALALPLLFLAAFIVIVLSVVNGATRQLRFG
jgi:4-amino-4-deoxy-L-arabinose transferase-like glycosyltransferase